MNPEFYLLSETAQTFLQKRQIKKRYKLFIEKCPICDKIRYKKLFSLNGFKYYKCKNCSFVFTNPRLNDEGSSLWYNSKYYNAALNHEIYINTIEDRYFSTSLSEPHFKIIVNVVEKFFENRNIKILDAGCSSGSILAYLKHKLNFTDLTGIDLNKKAVEFAQKVRGLNVKHQDITSLNQKAKFDLIISTENIEHVNSLKDYILNLKNHLKANGQILISTPNNDPQILKWAGKWGDHFCAPNHINYFNLNTITKFLNRYGFEIDYQFVDKIPGIGFYDLLKGFLTIPDQVITEPPLTAYFSKPIWFFLNSKKRRKLVKFDQIISKNNTPDKSNNQPVKLKKGIIKKIKGILSKPIVKTHNSHLFVLARLKK